MGYYDFDQEWIDIHGDYTTETLTTFIAENTWERACPSRHITTYWFRNCVGEWQRTGWWKYMLLKMTLSRGEAVARVD